ncbi:hypothetical protein DUI87_13886 [Hirundo rustica rustica]|uniref:Integrase-type domain-containing protein n=1 Tax=Hirundo rustica rustica TaxID=333673 RepID=A0A3M0K6U7_HIRRU|nr:hypothetical protein DUI87_13886 [Hirundo rustica rustica]
MWQSSLQLSSRVTGTRRQGSRTATFGSGFIGAVASRHRQNTARRSENGAGAPRERLPQVMPATWGPKPLAWLPGEGLKNQRGARGQGTLCRHKSLDVTLPDHDVSRPCLTTECLQKPFRLPLTESLHLSDTDWHLGSLDPQVLGSWQHVGRFELQEEKIQRMPPWKYLGLETGKRTIVPQKLVVKNNIRTIADVQQLCGSLDWVRPSWKGLTRTSKGSSANNTSQQHQPTTPQIQLSKALFTLHFLNCTFENLNPPSVRHFRENCQLQLKAKPPVMVKDPATRETEDTLDQVTWGHGYACVSTPSGPKWVPAKWVKPFIPKTAKPPAEAPQLASAAWKRRKR